MRSSREFQRYLCIILVLFFLSPGVSQSQAEQKYVVNLLSMRQSINLEKVKNLSSIKGRFQIVLYNKPIKSWTTNVLSVGYFSSINEANKVARSLGKSFNGAYASEFHASYTLLKTIDANTGNTSNKIVSKKPAAKKTTVSSTSTLTEERLDQIMLSARKALKTGDNKKAIQLFSVVLSVPENKYSADALELLGLARERNNQFNHAVNNYNKYINKYPDGDGVRRVRQRLAVLTTMTTRVDKSDDVIDVKSEARPWEMYGSWSQSYKDNDGEESELYSFLDVTARKSNEDTDLEFLFTGNRTSPISGDTDADFEIYEMYADVEFKNNGLSTRLGRIRSRSAGLYGRLDGLIISYDDLDTTRYNFMYGLPVDRSREQLFDSENEKLVYGLNAEMLFLDNALNLIAYLVEQRNDDLLDRQAVGTEVRYYKSDLTLFGLLDYDISYDQVGIFLMSGNWKTSGDATLFFNADYRSSPLLTTGNAVIGQTETDLGTLAAAIGEDAVRQLAEDRTSTSQLLSMGVSWPLDDKTSLRTDLTAATISSTPASGGVPATGDFGPDYYYTLQYAANDYFTPGDYTVLQFQYGDTSSSSKLSTLGSTRIPVTEKIKLTPRALLTFTDVEIGEDRTELRTSLRADYRYSNDLYMDIDLSMEFSDVDQPGDDDVFKNYYLIATYRWLF